LGQAATGTFALSIYRCAEFQKTRKAAQTLLALKPADQEAALHAGIQTPMNSSVGPTGQRTRSRSPEAV